MDDEILAKELERLCALKQSDSQRRSGESYSEVAQGVTAALSAHSRFNQGRNVFFGPKQLNLHAQYLPHSLIDLVSEVGAAAAVAWIHDLYQRESAEVRMIAAVHGLDVKEPTELGNGVVLLPFRSAPDSYHFRHFARNYQFPIGMTDVALAIPPAIAVLNLGTITASTDHRDGKSTTDNALDTIRDVARALTLLHDAAPVVGHSWAEFTDPRLARAEFGLIWMGAQYEGSPAHGQVAVDDEALSWINRYLTMDKALRDWVVVAVDRLNLAKRRRTPGDKAIDGSICLEALLGDDSPQELSFKLQLRAALLLGKDLSERQEIRAAVREFYGLRSKVVHGRVRPTTDKPRDTACVKRGLELCVLAIRKIVSENLRPDFAALELTGGVPPPAFESPPQQGH